ncbi:hypothetical protein [Candidatus Clostridium helianthi]|jgi:hypothetical protein|uniref:Transposase n=1 Tax=Candidatus Clostridium helianthi TaxID=3381660 RepID=A0ABW8S9I3_9CLOT
MLSNLGRTLDKMERKAVEKGKIEVAKNLLKMELTVDQVSIGTGISKEKVEKLRKEVIM